MKITIISVGKIKEKYLTEAIKEYSKRLGKYCSLEIIEVADEKTAENMSPKEEESLRQREGERILKHIKASQFVITLEINGEMLDSVQLSEKMNKLFVEGNSNICFIIGGSVGLDKRVSDMSNYKLSFSKMTFPHQLMRVILLEQIYRSFRILNNEPYHK